MRREGTGAHCLSEEGGAKSAYLTAAIFLEVACTAFRPPATTPATPATAPSAARPYRVPLM